jgi:hypothetical protein
VQENGPSRTNLAEELRLAEAGVADATTKKRLADEKVITANRAIETRKTDLGRVAGTFEGRADKYVMKLKEIKEISSQLPGLAAESRLAERKLEKFRGVVSLVRRQIAEHPEYSAAVAQQRKLIDDAVKVAEHMWSGCCLSNLIAAVKRFEEIADRELAFERTINVRLREAGVPLIRALLWNCDAVPSRIANLPLEKIEADCKAKLKQLSSR